jgi:hypothetical protein
LTEISKHTALTAADSPPKVKTSPQEGALQHKSATKEQQRRLRLNNQISIFFFKKYIDTLYGTKGNIATVQAYEK